MKSKFVVAIAMIAVSCQGPNPLRIASEKANLALARQCAAGWFGQIPFSAEDVRVVNNAFDDWERAIKADEALILGGNDK